MKIIQSKVIDNRTGYIVIPFLESYYTRSGIDNSIVKMLAHYDIVISDKYDAICKKIDQKMQNKLINIATLTIAKEKIGGARIKKTKKTTKAINKEESKHTGRYSSKTNNNNNNNNTLGNLLQIYLIRINDSSKSENELNEELRVTGHLIYNIMKNNFIRNCNLMPLLGQHYDKSVRTRNMLECMLECILEGLMLSSYKFDKYKTQYALESKIELQYHLDNIYLVNARSITPKRLARLQILVQSVFLARDLVNEPANDNRVSRFLDAVKGFIKKFKIPVELEVLDKNQLEKMGMGLILGVGKGSTPDNAPCMLVMKYHSRKYEPAKKQDKPEWVLLGKGITFDTGGLDLKSARSMYNMKSDLSGAAAVMAFLLGYAQSGGNKCIYTVCPFAENSISSSAIKPSDVLTAYDGRTVEVSDTDAEGRLVLADALAYSISKWPNARLLDMATLTGQAESISGKAFSCVLSSNAEEETRDLIEVSNRINESLVQLPILEKEKRKLESNVADIKNVNYKSSADIIMSSLFMKQFIKPESKWIHVDIAGPAFEADGIVKYASPEASGVGVRLLLEYFR
jgi:leucyl aminopeptidase